MAKRILMSFLVQRGYAMTWRTICAHRTRAPGYNRHSAPIGLLLFCLLPHWLNEENRGGGCNAKWIEAMQQQTFWERIFKNSKEKCWCPWHPKIHIGTSLNNRCVDLQNHIELNPFRSEVFYIALPKNETLGCLQMKPNANSQWHNMRQNETLFTLMFKPDECREDMR